MAIDHERPEGRQTRWLWEAVQFWVDPYQGHAPAIYALDTVTDLAADVIGAVVALRRAGTCRWELRKIDAELPRPGPTSWLERPCRVSPWKLDGVNADRQPSCGAIEPRREAIRLPPLEFVAPARDRLRGVTDAVVITYVVPQFGTSGARGRSEAEPLRCGDASPPSEDESRGLGFELHEFKNGRPAGCGPADSNHAWIAIWLEQRAITASP